MKENPYNNLLSSHLMPILIAAGSDLRYLAVNEEACTMYGYTKEEFLNMTAYDIRVPDEYDFLQQRKTEFKDFKIVESKHRKKNGDIIFVEVNGHAINYEGTDAYLVMVRDISEIKKAEDKLKTEHNILLTSQQMGKIGSWEVYIQDLNDWNKNSIVLSDESYRIFGYEPNSIEVSFPFVFEHIHPDDIHIMARNMEHLAGPNIIKHEEFRMLLKDGIIKNIIAKLQVIYDESQETPIKLIGIIQDVTQKKDLESQVETYLKNLRTAKLQTIDLIKKNEDLSSFNGNIAHDLKTPLRAMEIYIDLLGKSVAGNKEGEDYLDHLRNIVGEMKGMCSTLFDLAKFSKQAIKKENVNMKTEIERCIHSLSMETSNSNVEFRILDTPSLNVDKALIRNVLNNLLSNAVKYSSKIAKPIIEISGLSDGENTTYYVKDNGAGFDIKFKSKLFKPFSRLHACSEFEGSGMGLSIVEKIISRHGGSIWAESEKGNGATFFFKIPNN